MTETQPKPVNEFRDNPDLRPSDFQLIKCHMPGCNKIFTRRYTFERHIQNHDKMKKHICSFCGKRFGLKQYLKEHIFIHTGEKPYVCPYKGCGKRFRQRGKLSIHKKQHRERGDIEEEALVQENSDEEEEENKCDHEHDGMICDTEGAASGVGASPEASISGIPRKPTEYRKRRESLLIDFIHCSPMSQFVSSGLMPIPSGLKGQLSSHSLRFDSDLKCFCVRPFTQQQDCELIPLKQILSS